MNDKRWNEKIEDLKKQILTKGQFDGAEELWDIIPAICRAIGELADRLTEPEVKEDGSITCENGENMHNRAVDD